MQSRFAQRVFAFGLVAGIGLAVASCGSEAEVSGLYDHNYLSTCDKWPIARCEVDADCYSGLVYELGTRCIDGHCLCPVDGMIMCNRGAGAMGDGRWAMAMGDGPLARDGARVENSHRHENPGHGQQRASG